MVGTVIGISDLNVKVLLNNPDCVIVGDILTIDYMNQEHKFEVMEVNGNIAKTIPFDSVIFLKKGLPVNLKNAKPI